MASCQAINRPLVSVKLSLFCWFGALSSAQLYMTIYLKSLGINAQTAAFVTIAYPLSRIISPAISGPIADKMGRYKPVLYTSFSVQILMMICFLFVPHLRYQNDTINTSSVCSQQPICCSNITACHSSENFPINKTCFLCTHTCSKHRIILKTLNSQKSSKEQHCLCHLEDMDNVTNGELGCLMLSSCYAKTNECSINETGPLKNTINEYYMGINLIALLLTSYCIYQLFVATTYAMVETTTLAMVKLHNGNYGKHRMWSVIGMCIFAPLSGYFVDYISSGKEYTDYSPGFYLFIALTIMNIISVFIMDLEKIPPSNRFLKDLYNLLRRQKVCAFLSSLFFLGIFYGFVESYMFWYLQNMGSPKYLMGLLLTTSGMCALPLSYVSKQIINKFGCVSIITTDFFISSACFLAYSYLSNPWLVVLVHIPDSAFYHLMWISAATHSSRLVPDNLLASIQSAIVISHFGMGRGTGTLIGGNLIHAYGEPISFRCLGIACGILGGIYAILFYRSERYSGNSFQVKYSVNSNNELSEIQEI